MGFTHNIGTFFRASSCSGTVVSGYCWYYGGSSQSCTSVCSSHGGYDVATKDYAGSGGTTTTCSEVLSALGVGGGAISHGCEGQAVGCAKVVLLNARCSGSTTAGAAFPLTSRACACKN